MSSKFHLQRLTTKGEAEVYIELCPSSKDLRHLVDLATTISTYDKTVRVVDGSGKVIWPKEPK